MTEYLPAGVEPYTTRYMKSAIEDHFGDKIIFAEINGIPDVTFSERVSTIISEFYDSPIGNDCQAEKMRILRTAVKLIKSEVKSMPSWKSEYPEANQMSSVEQSLGFLPTSFRILLELLFTGNDAKRWRQLDKLLHRLYVLGLLIMPLLLGLAVEMHHHFASQYLIDTLNEHRFCSPYHEFQRFERNAALTSGTDVPNFTELDHIQYIDNVDHKVYTWWCRQCGP